MRSLANLFSPPTPEKIAEKELQDMRLTLFQAERRLLEAQMQVDYYRNMISFLEEVGATGVEGVADRRFAPAQSEHPVLQSPQPARTSPGLATIPIVSSAA